MAYYGPPFTAPSTPRQGRRYLLPHHVRRRQTGETVYTVLLHIAYNGANHCSICGLRIVRRGEYNVVGRHLPYRTMNITNTADEDRLDCYDLTVYRQAGSIDERVLIMPVEQVTGYLRAVADPDRWGTFRFSSSDTPIVIFNPVTKWWDGNRIILQTRHLSAAGRYQSLFVCQARDGELTIWQKSSRELLALFQPRVDDHWQLTDEFGFLEAQGHQIMKTLRIICMMLITMGEI
ncbi:hypothetical protein MIND_00261500 [Mycena indigotica]|uniref:Uncharacterized protein n=1 Tax=Mycena indigotica TaxID=2126181 RepID=A0A8H6WBC5_9AGAR|nr:uncharacterized protein MIND_00261500 [Mycena indigotica]KAF7312479.1 hypothetical protein MIND_00261500 [Mycena indigotica]